MSRNYCSNEHFHRTLGSEIVFRKNYRMLPMHMIKKKQMMVGAEDEGRTAAEQFYALAS